MTEARQQSLFIFNRLRRETGLPELEDHPPARVPHDTGTVWVTNCVVAEDLKALDRLYVGVYESLTRLEHEALITEGERAVIEQFVREVDARKHEDLVPEEAK